MISYDAGRLSLRRILGYLPTGLVWMVVASLVVAPASPAGWVAPLVAPLGAVGLGLALVLLMFCLGATLTPLNFSAAVALGSFWDWCGRLCWRSASVGVRRWLEANEIVSPLSLEERRVQMRDWITQHGAPTDLGPVSSGNVEWRIFKLLVMSRSSVFATEIVDLEAEANLYAGLALPLCVLGVVLLSTVSWLGILFIALGLTAPVRFQYARHRELDEIGNAYVALLSSGTTTTVPSEVSTSDRG